MCAQHRRDETVSRPVRQHNAAPSTRDAHELAERQPGASGEHYPEHAHDRVERAVAVRQRLCNADIEPDIERGGGARRARGLDEIRSDVDARDYGALSGGWNGEVARAARDVEDLLTRREGKPLDEGVGA
jgi:hypothetical protein